MTTPAEIRPRRARRVAMLATFAAAAVVALFVPEPYPRPARAARGQPFRWALPASRLAALEAEFAAAKPRGCGEPHVRASALADIDALAAAVEEDVRAARPQETTDAAEYRTLHSSARNQLVDRVFRAAAIAAACPEAMPQLVASVNRLRLALRRAVQPAALRAPDVRANIYANLYGTRAAVEEALLQTSSPSVGDYVLGDAVTTTNPHAVVRGVRIESGDILLSRGTAPTSALIARGNDFPGVFSHVAIAHVDATTLAVSVVEAHIERGTVVSTLAQYLEDAKHRVVVLRLRPRPDIALAHRAAEFAVADARRRHIPYDFTMSYRDHRTEFCSEVVYAAYEHVGVRLWTGLSTISGRGVVDWFSALGVRHMTTLAPADIEYDPALDVVVEWRNVEALADEHLDNAVIDAMLMEADEGRRFDYSIAMLPVARIAKAWSMALNAVGRVGPVPEGMSATVALRSEWLNERHKRVKARARAIVDGEASSRGIRPPYWATERLARQLLTQD